jgi:Ulp1 family protease
MEKHTITYYDSMQGNGDKYMHALLHCLQDDWKRTRGFDMLDVQQWRLHNAWDTPRQTNSYDCRAFVCLFALCMCLEIPMAFHQSDASAMRMILAHRIREHSIVNHTSHETATPPQHDKLATSTSTSSLRDDLDTGYDTIMSSSPWQKI